MEPAEYHTARIIGRQRRDGDRRLLTDPIDARPDHVCRHGGHCEHAGGQPEPPGETPRPRAEASSLLIAGGQALITTVPMPTGWHVLGRTPERFFSLGRDPVVLAAVGDEVRFDPVDASTFAALTARADAGEVIARIEDGD